ncbi:WecB/TagA/CpsF family glycosyltransferase [Rhodobacteraceae bacterium XHP0102]|nr:WecB/TagA/CpsF family glycosyltransferase [Rhodobacteraceae bacterium XHP0102]
MRLPEKIPSYDVLGIPISATTPAEVKNALETWAKDQKGRFVAVRDVASLMICREDETLRALHAKAALVLPDGMPLVWIGKKRGYDVARCSGPDVFEYVCHASQRSGLKHYFYGGQDGVAAQLAEVCRARFPDIAIVGWECPPFHPPTQAERADTRARILNSGADLVWVGISSPKQDLWMHEMVDSLPQTLIGIGAAFDFHTGRVRRAPLWMQRSGLEWLFRLISEPRRLWRRYLILAPRFLWLVVKSGLKNLCRS